MKSMVIGSRRLLDKLHSIIHASAELMNAASYSIIGSLQSYEQVTVGARQQVSGKHLNPDAINKCDLAS